MKMFRPLSILLWYLLHFLFKIKEAWGSGVWGWRMILQMRKEEEPSSSMKRDIETLGTLPANLRKLPVHLAIAVQSLDGSEMLKIGRVITWCWIMDIHFITLYDRRGLILQNGEELHHHVSVLLGEAASAVTPQKSLPSLRFVNVELEMDGGEGEGVRRRGSGIGGTQVLKVVLLEEESHCKGGIVEGTKAHLKKGLGSRPTAHLPDAFLNEALDFVTWEAEINKRVGLDWCDNEPELLMVFGTAKSTLGFLPWHVRLTEIHWLPDLGSATCQDFVGSLKKFSDCERRAGA